MTTYRVQTEERVERTYLVELPAEVEAEFAEAEAEKLLEHIVHDGEPDLSLVDHLDMRDVIFDLTVISAEPEPEEEQPAA
jgi:hypothetical protein